jgi:dienelactone hydrolase
MILIVALSGAVLSAQGSPASGAAPPPQEAASAQLSISDAVARAKAIVDLLAKQEFASVVARFDATMQMAVPADRLLAIWSGLTQQAGAFVKQTTATPSPGRGGTHVVVVRCEFARGAFDLQFAFDTTGLVSGFYARAVTTAPVTMPAYATPASFVEEAVTIGAGPRALPGTLTRPKAAGRHPAVVLVHGSGPNDRDETVGANRPFRDLALGLASRGIAVLRYDKRTKVFPTSLVDAGAFTVKEEVIDDAKAAVARLRTLPSIDPARIVLIGHSLGGTLAPRIAAADPRLAGLVVMAGATRSLPQAMLEQTRYRAMIDGVISVDEQAAVTRMGKLGDAVARLRAADVSNATMMEGAPASYWLDLRDYDPAASARALAIPMLILQGERDYQVTSVDFDGWKSGLASRKDVTLKLYPGLNHLFIAGAGQSLPSEYGVPGHVSADVIADVAAWIAALPPRK